MLNFSIEKAPHDLALELAHKTRLLRKKAGYSQSEFSKRSGVSLGSLKRFEAKGEISLSSFLLLVNLLNRLNDFENVLSPIDNLASIEKLFNSN